MDPLAVSTLIKGMTNRPTVIERAFELAREGRQLTEIKRCLRTEGYMDADRQIYGPTLVAALKRARLSAAPDTPTS
jgi:hypothetical protein